LQPGGYVINVARGKHLVEEDLIALIDSGHLAGATLDVFRTEPLPAEHVFWQHPKITVTPHTSARTLREESIAQIVGKIQALQRGEPINGVVDPSAVIESTLCHCLHAFNSSTSAPATACKTKSSLCPLRSRSSWCTACKPLASPRSRSPASSAPSGCRRWPTTPR
jgi:hypothetical protein